MSEAELDILRQRLRRGRRVPWFSIALFVVFAALAGISANGARLHAPLTEAGTLWPRVGMFGGLIFSALLLVLLGHFVSRIPTIRHAAAIERDDPTAVVFIGVRDPNLGGAVMNLAHLEAKGFGRNPAYFSVSISASGIAFWSRNAQWLNLMGWGWDRIKTVSAGLAVDDGTRGSGIRRPALMVTVTTTPKVIVVLPLVAVGRGLAGCFAQPSDVIDSIAQLCHELRCVPARDGEAV